MLRNKDYEDYTKVINEERHQDKMIMLNKMGLTGKAKPRDALLQTLGASGTGF